MYDAREVADRVAAVAPDTRVEIVPGASHDLPMHSVDLVIEQTVAFVQDRRRQAPGRRR